ncbi:LacI family DNA-binding transcriptional regulator [Leifsonia sp. LS-T14]|uniref:LacI family DNA-binding transcriptional regulator n=1 Tax=unclassified Leifsonia TaxID=2663824 RepID=UPI0035A69083
MAARAQVSKSAVSFVFNGRRGLSEATTDRILRAARELGWNPSARARALSRNRLRSVGLVLRRDGIAGPAGSDLVGFLDGVGAALATTATALVVRVAASRADEKEIYAGFVRDSQVDGVLVSGLRTDDDRPELLSRLGLPFVPTDHEATAEGGDMGTRDALRHLAEAGHRRVALIGVGSLVCSERRRQAFTEQSRALGLNGRVILLAGSTPLAAAATTERLLERHVPTAILYDTDLLAVAGMAAARRRGVAVPEDLSIVALDDGPAALLSDPQLTAVRRDAEGCGRASARRLLVLIGGGDRPDVVIHSPELVVRRSTGPVPWPRITERPT